MRRLPSSLTEGFKSGLFTLTSRASGRLISASSSSTIPDFSKSYANQNWPGMSGVWRRVVTWYSSTSPIPSPFTATCFLVIVAVHGRDACHLRGDVLNVRCRCFDHCPIRLADTHVPNLDLLVEATVAPPEHAPLLDAGFRLHSNLAGHGPAAGSIIFKAGHCAYFLNDE